MFRELVATLAAVLSAGASLTGLAQPPAESLTDAMLAQPAAYYSAPGSPNRFGVPALPRWANGQPGVPYSAGVGAPLRGAYAVPNGYGPAIGPSGVRLAQAPTPMHAPAPGLQTRPTNPAPTPAPMLAAPVNGLAAGGSGYGYGWPADYDEGWACGGRRGGAGSGGPGGFDMPQHYAYYPPMHGYYYFHPYHYTHLPAQQAFASQFGVDSRNPYSNDFFKVVYAEYKASLIRPAAEPIGTPLPESPTDVIKKLKALNDEGILSDEEFEAKKAEILQRM